MKGVLHIQPIEFYNPILEVKTYGVCVFDDDISLYDNTWEKLPDDPSEVLKKVYNIDDHRIQELLTDSFDEKQVIVVGTTNFRYDDYKDWI